MSAKLPFELDDRKRHILAAIVREYLNEAEPVGSRNIWKKYIQDLSPATIRNEMADLEEAGFITQPHTSAGRIPTEQAYRFYVDNLMNPVPASNEQHKQIIANYRRIHRDLEDILRKTMEVISSLTDYTAVVLVPVPTTRYVRIVQMVLLNVRQAMLILLTSSGTENVVVNLNTENLDQDHLNQISNLLTHKLSGLHAENFDHFLMDHLLEEMPRYRTLVNQILQEIRHRMQEAQKARVLAAGLSNLLKQPEFADSHQLKDLLELFEHDQLLSQIFHDYIKAKGVTIKIGKENKLKPMQNMSLVIRPIHAHKDALGGLGVVGPMRMSYDKVTRILEDVSQTVEEMLTDDEEE
jgi:heat-inducible transcriptional repressor